MNGIFSGRTNFLLLAAVITAISIIGLMTGVVTAFAQEEEPPRQVQELEGRIEANTRIVYKLLGLKAGETLFVRMENTSGNLDPFLILVEGGADLSALTEAVSTELADAVSEGRDPLVTLPLILDRYSLTWNDDYDDRSDAAFEFPIPESGSYQLVAGGAPGANSYGNFRLLVGLNAPEVLTGDARSTGDQIAFLDTTETEQEVSIKEIRSAISEESTTTSFTLRDLKAGETLYAYVETTSGELAPVLVFRNFSGKPLRSDNVSGASASARIEYLVEWDISDYKLTVESYTKDGVIPTGEYRLLVGVNASEVLSGGGESQGRSPLKEPIEIRIGTKLQQITGIDQQNEKFNAVAQLRMEWQDPELAFNPDECECEFVTFTGDSFSKYADEKEILWPQFTMFNQQGNRWVQNRNVVVYPDGRAFYVERYTTDFQAPLFNFTQFPFDQQQLYIQTVSVPPEKYFTYYDDEELSDIGGQLGEEEWYIVSSDTKVTIQEDHASFWLNFTVARHIDYYLYRIFIPIGLVILVSWIILFLKDYSRRVDVASANLLLFVAFNFTISGELPRLGYLTFMDAVLIGTFVVTVLVVIYNVALRRLEVDGRSELAHRIDKPAIWVYPLLYAIGGLVAYLMFFV